MDPCIVYSTSRLVRIIWVYDEASTGSGCCMHARDGDGCEGRTDARQLVVRLCGLLQLELGRDLPMTSASLTT